MSGRSGHVRKEIRKEAIVNSTGPSHISIKTFSDRYGYPPELLNNAEFVPLQAQISQSSGDTADRLRKPIVPTFSTATLESSGIEKSRIRAKMDKLSDAIREKLTLGKNTQQSYEKDTKEVRPATSSARGSDSYDAGSSNTGLTLCEPVSLPPSGPLPEVPDHQIIRQWVGGEVGPKQWRKLGRDPELWDRQGDVLIYLVHADSFMNGRHPTPSFRLSSSILDALNLTSLNEMLAHGCIDYSGSSLGGNYPGNFDPQTTRLQYAVQAANARKPLSSAGSETGSESYGNVSYELTFLAKSTTAEEKLGPLKYHISVRNFLAMISGKSLVGLNFASSLNELQGFIQNNIPDMVDPNAQIIKWLDRLKITDCRYNPNTATGLLTWFEDETCQNEEGYITAFCHAVAMYPFCIRTAEWKHVSLISKRILENAYGIMETKITDVQSFLHDFDFNLVWPAANDPGNSDARRAAKSFRQFLCDFYQAKYGTWPPKGDEAYGRWLIRSLTNTLQKDFGSLYDYLVDYDVYWEKNKDPNGRPWNLKSKKNPKFEADSKDMAFTSILLRFDIQNTCLRIPAPYPLMPRSIPVAGAHKSAKEEAEFLQTPAQKKKAEKKKKEEEDRQKYPNEQKKISPLTVAADLADKRKFALAFTTSTNLYRLGDNYPANDLLEAYIEFEKVDMFGKIDPFDARRGRWVLLYMILQVLANITVDVPDCKHKEGAKYFLCPQLQGVPPWKGVRTDFEEATARRSYCWNARRMWLDGELAQQQALLKLSPVFPLPPSGPRRYGALPVVPAAPASSVCMSTEMSVASSADTGYTQSVRSSSTMSNYTNQTSEGSSSSGPSDSRPMAKLRKNKFVPAGERLIEQEEEMPWPVQDSTRPLELGNPVSQNGDNQNIFLLSDMQQAQISAEQADILREQEQQQLASQTFQRQPSDSELSADRTQAFVREQTTENLGLDNPDFYEHLRNNEIKRAKTTSYAQAPAYHAKNSFLDYNLPTKITDFGRRNMNSPATPQSPSASGSPEPQYRPREGNQELGYSSDSGNGNVTPTITQDSPEYRQQHEPVQYRATPNNPNIAPRSPEQYGYREHDNTNSSQVPPPVPAIPAAQKVPAVTQYVRSVEASDVGHRGGSISKTIQSFDGAYDDDYYDYESIRDFDEYAMH